MSEKYYKLIFENPNPLKLSDIAFLKKIISQIRYEYNHLKDKTKKFKLGKMIDILAEAEDEDFNKIVLEIEQLKKITKPNKAYNYGKYNDEDVEVPVLNDEEKKQALEEIKKNKSLLESMIRMKTAHKSKNFNFIDFYNKIMQQQQQLVNQIQSEQDEKNKKALKNKLKQLQYPILNLEDFNKYEYLFNKLSIDDLKKLLSDRINGTEAQMEKLRDLQGNSEKKKIKLLKEQLLKAPNELEKMKLQRQIDKLKDIKHQKKLITTFNKSVNNTGQKLNLDNSPLVDNTMANSYVPKKFIPLFVKNEDGNGYHRITAAEIKKLQNDPSGDYYTGEGINRKNRAELYKYIGKDKGKMEELSGGSILGIATTLIPAGLNIAKYFIDKYTSKGTRGGNVSGEGVKHEDLKGGSNTYNAFNQNGFNIGKYTPFTGGAVYNGFNQTQFKMSKDGFFEPI